MATKHTHFDSTEFNTLRNSAIPAAIMASPNTRFDSAEEASVFFARELDHVKAKTYDVEYPELTALSNFPISSEADAGDNTITYYTYDKTGLAKVIDNYSTDLPRADVTGKPSIALIKSVGDSYGYSAQEMRASRRAGKSLDVRKAESARYQIDNLINKIAWRGDEESGLMGVLSAGQNIPLYTITAGADSSKTTWLEKTADEILLDVNGMGAKKMEQYGGRFLEKIRSVTGGDREGWGADPSLILSGADAVGEERGDSPTPLTEKRAKGRKEEFRLTDEILSAVRYVPETTISDFAAQINDLRDESRMKRLTVKWLTEKLMEEGCLEKKYWNGFTRTVLTEKGREAEIRAEERISSKGNPYEVFLYTEKAQRYLVELLKKKGADE